MSEGKMNIGSAEGDQVLELDINRLRAFKNHPFKVTADMSMVELKDSIEKYGILKHLTLISGIIGNMLWQVHWFIYLQIVL